MSNKKHNLPVRRRGDKWQVDARKAGGGQTTYPTRAQAEGAAQAAWDDHVAAQMEEFDFSMDRRRIAVAAFRELVGYTDEHLIEAAKFYREHIPAAMQRRTVAEVVEEYLQSLAGNVAAVTMQNDYRPKFKKFSGAFGATDLSTITASDLERWFDAEKMAPLYREAWRNRLGTFWRFSIGRNYAKVNAAQAIKTMSRGLRKKLKSAPPAILNADELRALLSAAAEYRRGIMLPYFAVCALAGIRPDEAKRIGWENVSFTDKEIRVPAEASKTGDPREVELPDALVAWLDTIPAIRRNGLFAWSRGMFEKVREDAGLTERWSEPKGKDILRHSAASHDYRLHGNMEKTAAKMGHDVIVFKGHYKAVVATRTEAEAYFAVYPANHAPALELRKAAG
jgi:integrase